MRLLDKEGEEKGGPKARFTSAAFAEANVCAAVVRLQISRPSFNSSTTPPHHCVSLKNANLRHHEHHVLLSHQPDSSCRPS